MSNKNGTLVKGIALIRYKTVDKRWLYGKGQHSKSLMWKFCKKIRRPSTENKLVLEKMHENVVPIKRSFIENALRWKLPKQNSKEVFSKIEDNFSHETLNVTQYSSWHKSIPTKPHTFVVSKRIYTRHRIHRYKINCTKNYPVPSDNQLRRKELLISGVIGQGLRVIDKY